MEKIMNKENKWDHMVETDVVERPVEKVARNKIVEPMQKIKSGKATGPSEVSREMIVASGKIKLKVHMCFVDMKKAFDRVPRKVMV